MVHHKSKLFARNVGYVECHSKIVYQIYYQLVPNFHLYQIIVANLAEQRFSFIYLLIYKVELELLIINLHNLLVVVKSRTYTKWLQTCRLHNFFHLSFILQKGAPRKRSPLNNYIKQFIKWVPKFLNSFFT